jgi:hypothetical protein
MGAKVDVECAKIWHFRFLSLQKTFLVALSLYSMPINFYHIFRPFGVSPRQETDDFFAEKIMNAIFWHSCTIFLSKKTRKTKNIPTP